jgi:hypothetical protein
MSCSISHVYQWECLQSITEKILREDLVERLKNKVMVGNKCYFLYLGMITVSVFNPKWVYSKRIGSQSRQSSSLFIRVLFHRNQWSSNILLELLLSNEIYYTFPKWAQEIQVKCCPLSIFHSKFALYPDCLLVLPLWFWNEITGQ